MDRRDPLDDPETWSDLSRRMVALSQRDARRRMEEETLFRQRLYRQEAFLGYVNINQVICCIVLLVLGGPSLLRRTAVEKFLGSSKIFQFLALFHRRAFFSSIFRKTRSAERTAVRGILTRRKWVRGKFFLRQIICASELVFCALFCVTSQSALVFLSMCKKEII